MIDKMFNKRFCLRAACASLLFSASFAYCFPTYAQEVMEENLAVEEMLEEEPAETEDELSAEDNSGLETEAAEAEDAETEAVEAGTETTDTETTESITEEVPSTELEAESQPAEVDEALFADLKEYLDSNDLREADKETFRVLRVLVGEQSVQQGYFSLVEWEAFVNDENSCSNVQRIDELWKEASNGTLGFSEQKRLFDATRGNAIGFYSAIGWIEPGDELKTAVEWRRVPLESAAEKAVAYVDQKEPNFENPVSGHLPAMMYWEEDSDGLQRDRRLALFAKCGL